VLFSFYHYLIYPSIAKLDAVTLACIPTKGI